MQALSYSVPATPVQGGQFDHSVPAAAQMAQRAGPTASFEQHSLSLPTTPVLAGDYSATAASPSPARTAGGKADPASLARVLQSVSNEQSNLAQLQSSIQQLSSPSKSPSFSQHSSLPPRPSPGAASRFAMNGRPLMSFSPSPPPVLGAMQLKAVQTGKTPSSGEKPVVQQPLSSVGKPPIPGTSASRSTPSSAPLPPFTPSTSFGGAAPLTPLSIIEERSPVILNLNDSFASVASDPSYSPIRDSAANSIAAASPNSPHSPSSLPASPNSLKEVIRTQRQGLALAGEYGSKLVSEMESLEHSNTSLRSQLAEVQEAASLTSGQVAAMRSMADFIRAEIQATNTSDRGMAAADADTSQTSATAYQVSGNLATDLTTFQALLRAQRKSAREHRSNLETEVERLQQQCQSQSASIQNLQAASSHWSTLQKAHTALQQAHDELEIQQMEVQTKLKLQASQHQSMLQIVHDQRDEAQAEANKTKEKEKIRRESLEKQVTQLKAQLANMSSREQSTAASAEQQSTGVNVKSRDSLGRDLNIFVTPAGGLAPPRSELASTSLADDLASADSDSPRPSIEQQRQQQQQIRSAAVAPLSNGGVALNSSQVSRVSDHFDSVMSQESRRQEVREGWHQAESLWFFERERARDVEAQALDMRREERAEELAQMERLSEGKQAQVLIEQLREQLRASHEREAELREGQETQLAQSLADMIRKLDEKEEEIAMLRSMPIATPTMPNFDVPRTPHTRDTSQHDSHTPDLLSTPTLRASKGIAAAHRFTPTSLARAVEHAASSSTPASPVAPPSQSQQQSSLQSFFSSASHSKPDAKLRSGVRDVTALTHAVLREVQTSSRSSRIYLGGLFFVQMVFVLVWFLLTNGGSAILADHPLVQTALTFIDQATNAKDRFQS